MYVLHLVNRKFIFSDNKNCLKYVLIMFLILPFLGGLEVRAVSLGGMRGIGSSHCRMRATGYSSIVSVTVRCQSVFVCPGL